MVGRFNPGQRLGLGGFRENGFHGGTPPVLVVRAVEKMSAAAAIGEKIPFAVLDRRTDSKEALHAGVFAANDAQPDPGAKRKPRRQQRQARVVAGGIAQRGAEIVLLADAFVVSAGALAGAPKVEPYDRRPGLAGRSGQPENHLVVHRPAMERVRVANNGHALDGTPLAGTLDEGFQPSGGTVNES